MEYGLDLLKRSLYFAWRNPENLFFLAKTTVILPIFIANNGWSLWLLEKAWQQAVVFVSNKFMSSFVMSCYGKINFLDSVIVQK